MELHKNSKKYDPADDGPLVRPDQAAEIVGLRKGTLDQYRARRIGPPYVRKGRKIYYPKQLLEEWDLRRTVLVEPVP